jgi:hypothetical protein
MEEISHGYGHPNGSVCNRARELINIERVHGTKFTQVFRLLTNQLSRGVINVKRDAVRPEHVGQKNWCHEINKVGWDGWIEFPIKYLEISFITIVESNTIVVKSSPVLFVHLIFFFMGYIERTDQTEDYLLFFRQTPQQALVAAECTRD